MVVASKMSRLLKTHCRGWWYHVPHSSPPCYHLICRLLLTLRSDDDRHTHTYIYIYIWFISLQMTPIMDDLFTWCSYWKHSLGICCAVSPLWSSDAISSQPSLETLIIKPGRVPCNYLNQRWLIVNWTLRNIYQCNFHKKQAFLLRKCNWKFQPQNGGHFGQGPKSNLTSDHKPRLLLSKHKSSVIFSLLKQA